MLPQAQTKGMQVIVDLAHMTAAHAGLINPNLIKKLLVVFQEAYPMDNDTLVTLSSIFFLNMPTVIEKLVKIAISLMNKKYKTILKVQDSATSTLLAEAGAEILPAEYGGTNGTCAELTEFWRRELGRHEDWFRAQASFRTDEECRQGKNKLHYILGCSIM